MIYLLCSNKILELDIKSVLLSAGYQVEEPSIFELPYLKFNKDVVLIISKNLADRNSVLRNFTKSEVVVITALPHELLLKSNYPPNYHFLSMPVNHQELLALLQNILNN